MTHEHDHGASADRAAGDHSRDQHAGHGQHTREQAHHGHADHPAPGGDDHSGHDHAGHDHSHHVQLYARLFWIMLALGIPTVAFSPMFGHLLGYEVTGWGLWVAPVLGTVMYVWGGRPFLTGGAAELRERQPGMMLLISLGITVAFLASWGATLGLLDPELEFWWELALLVVIMLLGHWVEALARPDRVRARLPGLPPPGPGRARGG